MRLKNFRSPEGKLIKNKRASDHLIREDGRVERVCQHGVGHPVGHVVKWQNWMGTHGCDGCCSQWGETDETS